MHHRLSAERAEDLAWFWNRAEYECGGLRSNSGVVMDLLEMGFFKGEGGRVAFDPMPDAGERSRRRAWHVHRVVQRIQESPGGVRHCGVLFRVLGPQHWRSPFGHFAAELAPIVEDTPVVAEMIRLSPTLSKASAVEHAIKMSKKFGSKLLQKLETQAGDMLSAASVSADAAFDRQALERRLQDERRYQRVA